MMQVLCNSVEFWIILEQFHLNVKYPLLQLIYNTL